MDKNNIQIRFLILKIIGFLAISVAIVGLILIFTGFGDFESNNFMIGGFMMPFGLVIGMFCLVNGFRPEITKASLKTAKYIQQQNKDDIKEIINTTANLNSEAITQTANAFKNGIKDTKFCKHCGAEIDLNSNFCKICGKEQ